jgi:hypothetical protein
MDFLTELGRTAQAEDVSSSFRNDIQLFVLIPGRSIALPQRYVRGQACPC